MVTGPQWSAETLREILLRPRNAGRMIYQGEEIGDAPWAPIVPVETFRAVQRILTNPDRRTGPGAAPKWLGTNIYLCGPAPETTARVWTSTCGEAGVNPLTM
jgi:hypothetical protein